MSNYLASLSEGAEQLRQTWLRSPRHLRAAHRAHRRPRPQPHRPPHRPRPPRASAPSLPHAM